jgi:hypothetical protein
MVESKKELYAFRDSANTLSAKFALINKLGKIKEFET